MNVLPFVGTGKKLIPRTPNRMLTSGAPSTDIFRAIAPIREADLTVPVTSCQGTTPSRETHLNRRIANTVSNVQPASGIASQKPTMTGKNDQHDDSGPGLPRHTAAKVVDALCRGLPKGRAADGQLEAGRDKNGAHIPPV
ncbi:hypothetical protein [Pseudarthrobacter sp. NPDC058119]|uniref:hypothetical protein n=1 Tax=Pseudarthrobacter sp. NPDC058119 TaxID=3346348 RepID=UPI0036DE60B8